MIRKSKITDYFYPLWLLSFLFLQACSGIYPSTIKMPSLSYVEQEQQRENLDRIIKGFDNPQSLALYMKEAMPCVPDYTQYSQYPLDTFLLGRGDCEDQAIFAAYSLQSMGYYAATILLKWRGFSSHDNAHAVAFYFQGSHIFILDNCLKTNLAGPFTSFDKVTEFIQETAHRRIAWYRIYSWQEFLLIIP